MKLWYKIRFGYCRLLWSSGVYIYYSIRLTKVVVGNKWLFVPFSFYRLDNQESFLLLSKHIREALVKGRQKHGNKN